ncbi:MAG: Rpp14/Pop5 family protein [Candidatus Aenigmatarchaeota archaeon]
MSKPETLPSSLREKKRYIAFEIIGEEKIGFGELINAIWSCMLELFGEANVGDINFWLVKDSWDKENQRGLIKCNHNHVSKVRLALALVERIGDLKVSIRTMGVSGTMKSARKKFFGEKDLTSFQ